MREGKQIGDHYNFPSLLPGGSLQASAQGGEIQTEPCRLAELRREDRAR